MRKLWRRPSPAMVVACLALLVALSGTGIAAAEKTGRRCIAIELDPRFVDVIVLRWQQLTGKGALLEGTQQSFAELAAERLPRAA